MTEYQFGSSPVQAVLEMQEKIVARKKDCIEDAGRDYDRCIRMYNDQRHKLAALLPVGTVQEEEKDGTDQDGGSRGEGGIIKSAVDSDVSLQDQGEDRDITDSPTTEMVTASEREMVMEDYCE